MTTKNANTTPEENLILMAADIHSIKKCAVFFVVLACIGIGLSIIGGIIALIAPLVLR